MALIHTYKGIKGIYTLHNIQNNNLYFYIADIILEFNLFQVLKL